MPTMQVALESPDLWQQYHATRSPELRNQLIVKYLPILKFIALRLADRIRKSGGHVDIDDLYQSGTFGLRDAIASFDPTRGVKFETYCNLRIRGAMLDGLKPLDPLPREVRQSVHALREAAREFRVEFGREPDPHDLAGRLQLPHEACQRLLRAARDASPHSLYDTNDDNTTAVDQIIDRAAPRPDQQALRRELRDALLCELSRTERLILILYYDEELTMREIGETLGVTATRVCQIHGQLLRRLRARLTSTAHHLAPEYLDIP